MILRAAVGIRSVSLDRTVARLGGGETMRADDAIKSFSPAIENVPIISTRINQTMIATKIGTTLSKVCLSTTAFPKVSWFKMAIEIPHQVSIAFIVAASIQAPKRYQTSVCESP
jgi:hypothetical protein